jgi:hypothetical protein
MHSKQLKLVVRHGTIRAIYDDELTALFDGADVKIERASHVEPYTVGPELDRLQGWSADLSPVGGPLLANFPTRQAALDAEAYWLNQNVIT